MPMDTRDSASRRRLVCQQARQGKGTQGGGVRGKGGGQNGQGAGKGAERARARAGKGERAGTHLVLVVQARPEDVLGLARARGHAGGQHGGRSAGRGPARRASEGCQRGVPARRASEGVVERVRGQGRAPNFARSTTMAPATHICSRRAAARKGSTRCACCDVRVFFRTPCRVESTDQNPSLPPFGRAVPQSARLCALII